MLIIYSPPPTLSHKKEHTMDGSESLKHAVFAKAFNKITNRVFYSVYLPHKAGAHST